jgi:DNA-directed RNA polymerase specialized sigma24 family protein
MRSDATEAVGIDDGMLRDVDATERFRVLIQPLLAGAFGLACAMLGDREDAEEAVQEAAVKAWKAISTVRSGAAPQPWFFAIVANQCRDMRRRARPHLQLSDIVEPAVADHADAVDLDLDLRVGTVKSRLHRTLSKLKAEVTSTPTEEDR